MNTSDEPVCAHFRVRGRVQGVFYRASTQERAMRLGLKGWVRNTQDGAVELVACGPQAQVAELERWLWQGPPSAHVESVERTAVSSQYLSAFEVRR